MADAVDYLHHNRIIHRDIKPSNILITPTYDSPVPALAKVGVPRLTDFGLAKLKELAGTEPTVGATQDGQILGTAEFMAPEQAHGRMAEVNEASDVYSLGAVLYALLAGKPPIRGRNRFETMQLLPNEDPQRLRELRPPVSRELEAICLRCLEKNPRKRYATAADLASELNRYLQGTRTHTRPIPWHREVRKKIRRHPRLLRIGIWALIAFVVGIAGFAEIRRETLQAQNKDVRKMLFEAELTSLHTYVAHLRDNLPAVESDLRVLCGRILRLIISFAHTW